MNISSSTWKWWMEAGARKIQDLVRRRQDALVEVASAARALAPTHRGQELSEKVLQLDGIEQEMADFVREDPGALMRSFL